MLEENNRMQDCKRHFHPYFLHCSLPSPATIRKEKTKFGHSACFRSFLYTVRTFCPFWVLDQKHLCCQPLTLFWHQFYFFHFVHVACSTPVQFLENQFKTTNSSSHVDTGAATSQPVSQSAWTRSSQPFLSDRLGFWQATVPLSPQ